MLTTLLSLDVAVNLDINSTAPTFWNTGSWNWRQNQSESQKSKKRSTLPCIAGITAVALASLKSFHIPAYSWRISLIGWIVYFQDWSGGSWVVVCFGKVTADSWIYPWTRNFIFIVVIGWLVCFHQMASTTSASSRTAVYIVSDEEDSSEDWLCWSEKVEVRPFLLKICWGKRFRACRSFDSFVEALSREVVDLLSAVWSGALVTVTSIPPELSRVSAYKEPSAPVGSVGSKSYSVACWRVSPGNFFGISRLSSLYLFL